MDSMKTIIRLAVAVAAAVLIGLPALFGSWYQVDQGEMVVITRNGAVIGEAGPGLHYKLPIIDSVHTFDVKTDKLGYKDIAIYSLDQQQGSAVANINFHVDPAHVKEVYGQLRDQYEQLKVAPLFLQQVSVEFGKVNAQQIINARDKLSQAIADNLHAQLEPYHIVVESVQIEQVAFNQHFTDAINELIKQEVAVRTRTQTLEQEKVNAETAVTIARGQAESVKAKAEGDAYAVTVAAKAEAESIRIRGRALSENPGLVELTKAQQWDGKMPTMMVPGGATPMLDLRAR